MQWKLTGKAWVKDPQADKPDTDVPPSILGGSLSFGALKRAPLGERLPHHALTRPDVIIHGDSEHWASDRWLSQFVRALIDYSDPFNITI